MAEPDWTLLLESLASQGATLATAESLTGGGLAAAITEVPGASRVFVGGVVSYATRVKVSLLGVPENVIRTHGVVSEEVARAMATGVRARLEATYALATTGVAGPGPAEGVPAGTVWLALAGPDGVEARLLLLQGGRGDVRRATVHEALGWLGTIAGEEPTFG